MLSLNFGRGVVVLSCPVFIYMCYVGLEITCRVVGIGLSNIHSFKWNRDTIRFRQKNQKGERVGGVDKSED